METENPTSRYTGPFQGNGTSASLQSTMRWTCPTSSFSGDSQPIFRSLVDKEFLAIDSLVNSEWSVPMLEPLIGSEPVNYQNGKRTASNVNNGARSTPRSVCHQ